MKATFWDYLSVALALGVILFWLGLAIAGGILTQA